ncbi:hypothetical protein BVRB_9g214450 [Beta vulgaris subsp. vulgaris]|nr:hypothetical protein BVRB_9g214450 [Beta vulgaris subsp. vulgaris]
MIKLIVTFCTFVLFTSYIVNASSPKSPKWAVTKRYGHERKTVLQFYFHDIVTGESPTVTLIAQPVGANPAELGFGSLLMADDPLTISPDRKSKLVGRAQGLYGGASQEGVNLVMGLTYGFVDGIYNGSTLIIFGRNSIMNPVRELPVIGGTGFFRAARGYAVAQTYDFNLTSYNAVVGYNVTVFHPY